MGALDELLSLVAPARCVACGIEAQGLCARCRARLRHLDGPLCDRCGRPTAWPVRRCSECAGRRLAFANARAAVAYDAVARAFVSAWKERGERSLSALACELVLAALARPDVHRLTFVPAARDRLLWRGNDPPGALARALGRAWELPVGDVLERSCSAPRQRGLPLSARRLNVARTFSAREPLSGAVCVVDDVYTSGATVGACATELRRAGAGAGSGRGRHVRPCDTRRIGAADQACGPRSEAIDYIQPMHESRHRDGVDRPDETRPARTSPGR